MGNEVSGRIFSIQRYCVNDGPGIRTTVFMQGCPLHCLWCHNPESRRFEPSVSFRKNSCLGCGRCRALLPGNNCRRDPGKKCSGCGICVEECPGSALVLQGRKTTVEKVMEVLRRDIFYYRESGGGITLSGGEPCAQKEFSAALLAAAKSENIHTAVESSGAVPRENIALLAPHCDLWLFDIKAAPEEYCSLTGADYARVRANLQYLSDYGARIILRVPLTAGANLVPALLDELKELVTLPGVLGAELLPYHDMGRGKSTMCGLAEPEWQKFSPPSEEILQEWKSVLADRSGKKTLSNR